MKASGERISEARIPLRQKLCWANDFDRSHTCQDAATVSNMTFSRLASIILWCADIGLHRIRYGPGKCIYHVHKISTRFDPLPCIAMFTLALTPPHSECGCPQNWKLVQPKTAEKGPLHATARLSNIGLNHILVDVHHSVLVLPAWL